MESLFLDYAVIHLGQADITAVRHLSITELVITSNDPLLIHHAQKNVNNCRLY